MRYALLIFVALIFVDSVDAQNFTGTFAGRIPLVKSHLSYGAPAAKLSYQFSITVRKTRTGHIASFGGSSYASVRVNSRDSFSRSESEAYTSQSGARCHRSIYVGLVKIRRRSAYGGVSVDIECDNGKYAHVDYFGNLKRY